MKDNDVAGKFKSPWGRMRNSGSRVAPWEARTGAMPPNVDSRTGESYLDTSPRITENSDPIKNLEV